jgi:peptidoglycan/xylan/chitin deacetylase (PgdA/CDA1 family)
MTDKKLIALTFDDGSTEITPLVLDKLQKHNIVASFFIVGHNVTDETILCMKPLIFLLSVE